MNNSNTEKPTKSMIWIVATIWANIIIIGLIVTFAIMFLRPFLFQLFGPTITGFTIILFVTGSIIYAIRLGVKSVLKKSVIEKEQIFKISFGVSLVFLFLVTILAFLLLITDRMSIGRFLGFGLFSFLVSLGYFGITYLWCKKLIKQ